MSSPLSAIPGIEQIIQVFIADYSDYKASIITSVGATAILWWEYLITFDNEVEYFWGRASWPQTLFLANRYLTLFSRTFDTAMYFVPKPSYPLCVFWVGYFQTGTSSAEVFLADMILILRLWAIYGRSRTVLICMSTLLLFCATASVAVLGVQSEHVTGSNEPLPGFHLCILTSKLNILYAYFIPIVIFEGAAFLLVAFKALEHMKVNKGRSIMTVIFRDSICYFFAALACLLANAFVYRFGRPGLYDIFQGPTTAVICIIVSRMLLNLRKEAKRGLGEDTGTKMSTLHFDQGTRRHGRRTDEEESAPCDSGEDTLT